jgi:thiamine biosynthesis protein ThiS
LLVRVQINGEKRDIDAGATLASLVAELGLGERRIAVELNHGVVSRDRWSAVELRDDDLVEIVQFVGGG